MQMGSITSEIFKRKVCMAIRYPIGRYVIASLILIFMPSIHTMDALIGRAQDNEAQTLVSAYLELDTEKCKAFHDEIAYEYGGSSYNRAMIFGAFEDEVAYSDTEKAYLFDNQLPLDHKWSAILEQEGAN